MIEERQSNGLYRLLYISQASYEVEDAGSTAREIATASELRNRSKGVTGGLVAHASWFIQVLEGPHEAVAALYSDIANDRRHRDVRLVSMSPIEARMFSRWGMRAGQLKSGQVKSTFDPSGVDEATLLSLVKIAVMGLPKLRVA